MLSKILFLHKSDVNLMDFIHLNNFRYSYTPATYWEPEDEDVKYNLSVDKEFYDNILLVPVQVDENSEIHYFEYDNIDYLNTQEDEYLKFFEREGYEPFYEGELEDFADNEEEAKERIESYLEVLENEAVDYIVDTYYR